MLSSISLDLDNKWSYLKTHGDPGWEQFPTYLPKLIPRVLQLLDKLELSITFFIVGQDAALQVNHSALASIAQAGHEIGNHSFHHEPWLHLYSEQQLEEEFQRSEEAIERCTGIRTRGFRGPGFSFSGDVLRILSLREYRYDASTFPTFLGPVARAYYFMHSGLDRSGREQRKQLFGSWSDGLRSLRPYRWETRGKGLLEIPVTTMPWIKVPIHLSYIMYLSCFSKAIAKIYFKNAMRWCQLNRIEPSLLLHPLDFMGRDDDSDLFFFPGMSLEANQKMELAGELLGWMKDQFECVTMIQHSESIETRSNLQSKPLPSRLHA